MARQGISALVNSAWLAKQLGSTGHRLRILDAGAYSEQSPFTAAARIAGARNFDINECCDKSSGLTWTLPSAKLFSDYVGQGLGIGNGDHIVVYDTSINAPRVWWMFRAFGHSAVSVLDGGLAEWARQGRPLKTGPLQQSYEPQQYQVAVEKPQLYSDFEHFVHTLRTGEQAVVDARPPQRYLGLDTEPHPNVRVGCAVGSVNLFFRELYDPATGRMLDKQQLQQLFTSRGVDPSKPFVATCGAGITACHLALAAAVTGNQQVSVFDGSWQEFSKRGPDELIMSGRES